MQTDPNLQAANVAAKATAAKINHLLDALDDGPQGLRAFTRAANQMVIDQLSTAVGSLMPIPLSATGLGLGGPDGTVHLLLYANVYPEDALKISEGFLHSVDSFLVPSVLGNATVNRSDRHEVV